MKKNESNYYYLYKLDYFYINTNSLLSNIMSIFNEDIAIASYSSDPYDLSCIYKQKNWIIPPPPSYIVTNHIITSLTPKNIIKNIEKIINKIPNITKIQPLSNGVEVIIGVNPLFLSEQEMIEKNPEMAENERQLIRNSFHENTHDLNDIEYENEMIEMENMLLPVFITQWYRKNYCNFHIAIFKNGSYPNYIVELNRLRGNCNLSSPIWVELKEHIIREETCGEKRSNYLALLIGVSYTETSHISHYLLNELVAREICEYLA